MRRRRRWARDGSLLREFYLLLTLSRQMVDFGYRFSIVPNSTTGHAYSNAAGTSGTAPALAATAAPVTAVSA